MRQTYRFIQTPVIGRFLERLNRFACLVDIRGQPTKVYLPNSGRLKDLLIPGARAMLEERRQTGMTRHDLLLIEAPRFPDQRPIWVGLDSRLPTKLLRWSIRSGLITLFGVPEEIASEPRIEDGRLDLKVVSGARTHWIETKSVNMLDLDGRARFPDAPTARGSKHLSALMARVSRDTHSWMLFVVMREDANSFSAFGERDPAFSELLAQAQETGVGILAYKFAVGRLISFQGPIPVLIPESPFPGPWKSDIHRAEGTDPGD